MKLDRTALGKNLRMYRAAAGMTQERLAEIVGCSDRNIGLIETGKGMPSLSTAVAIANALGVGLDQLILSDLENPTNYFIRELTSLTEGFEGRDRLLAMELITALVSVLKNFKT
jgi:transcriptional regulator with XRE-family HTH domain